MQTQQCTQQAMYTFPARLGRNTGTSGLVCTIAAPTAVAVVLDVHGFTQQRPRACEIARLRRGHTVVAVYYSGMLIALSSDNYGLREFLAAIWGLVQQGTEVQR